MDRRSIQERRGQPITAFLPRWEPLSATRTHVCAHCAVPGSRSPERQSHEQVIPVRYFSAVTGVGDRRQPSKGQRFAHGRWIHSRSLHFLRGGNWQRTGWRSPLAAWRIVRQAAAVEGGQRSDRRGTNGEVESVMNPRIILLRGGVCGRKPAPGGGGWWRRRHAPRSRTSSGDQRGN